MEFFKTYEFQVKSPCLSRLAFTAAPLCRWSFDKQYTSDHRIIRRWTFTKSHQYLSTHNNCLGDKGAGVSFIFSLYTDQVFC